MSVTTVDIDKALLDEAKDVLGASTVRAAVDLALREVVMRRRQAVALDSLAGLDLDLHPTKVEHDQPAAPR
ncbi:MAG: type II toxin-antitoxin system VapB family antitoxin [Streptosporangiaceae bacterium]